MTGMDAGIARLYQAVAAIGLPLMVGGGVAAIFFGEPRTTLDIGIVIDATPKDAERIIAAIDADRFYVPPIEALRNELARGGSGHLNIIDFDTGMKADLYPAGDDPLIRFGLEHAMLRDLAGIQAMIAPATYVVAMKLRYFTMSHQDKHLRDIRSILALSPAEVDRASVDRWASAYSAVDAWRLCQGAPGQE